MTDLLSKAGHMVNRSGHLVATADPSDCACCETCPCPSETATSDSEGCNPGTTPTVWTAVQNQQLPTDGCWSQCDGVYVTFPTPFDTDLIFCLTGGPDCWSGQSGTALLEWTSWVSENGDCTGVSETTNPPDQNLTWSLNNNDGVWTLIGAVPGQFVWFYATTTGTGNCDELTLTFTNEVVNCTTYTDPCGGASGNGQITDSSTVIVLTVCA